MSVQSFLPDPALSHVLLVFRLFFKFGFRLSPPSLLHCISCSPIASTSRQSQSQYHQPPAFLTASVNSTFKMRSALILSFAGLTAAHFRMLHPESVHFSDSTEDQSPCGGRVPDFPSDDDDLFQYHIGGEDIATELTHEASNWLIRVTTDEKASKGWEQVFPIYAQSGLGRFYQPKVAIPDKYEGKKGIISIVSEATDGILYQVCAPICPLSYLSCRVLTFLPSYLSGMATFGWQKRPRPLWA